MASGSEWQRVLELSSDRKITRGTPDALVLAIARGADLHVVTQFRHNEHIDTKSPSDEPIAEVMKFPVTYLIDGRWVAGIQNLRQPVALPEDFGPRASMSFFLYNQDAQQAVARPFLDGERAEGPRGASEPMSDPTMPRMHFHDHWDAATNAPSYNFVYDFDHYRFFVRETWREVLSHDENGKVVSGSVDALTDALNHGREVKLAIAGLCADLGGEALRHEVFSLTIAGYCYLRQGLFIAASQPLVRVRPGIPMRYTSGGWDFGWVIARTDGLVSRLLYDPYTLKTRRDKVRCAIRWFIS